MCAACMMGATTAAAGASGMRAWLRARGFSWLTPRRMRVLTIALLAGALVVASVGFGGA
jgi:hypothetical protein